MGYVGSSTCAALVKKPFCIVDLNDAFQHQPASCIATLLRLIREQAVKTASQATTDFIQEDFWKLTQSLFASQLRSTNTANQNPAPLRTAFSESHLRLFTAQARHVSLETQPTQAMTEENPEVTTLNRWI